MITIRCATPADEASIYRFVSALEAQPFDRALFHIIYQQNINHPDYYYRVAEKENTVRGFISLHTQLLLHHAGRTGEIQELYVDEQSRGKGVGQRLLAEVETIGKTLALVEIEVTAQLHRTDTHRFYQRAGYTQSHAKFTKPLLS